MYNMHEYLYACVCVCCKGNRKAIPVKGSLAIFTYGVHKADLKVKLAF